MVEAKRSLSRTKPRDYRPILYALARYYAREAAKDQIRARGEKISAYLPKDATVMAMQLSWRTLIGSSIRLGTLSPGICSAMF
jgi:hypothetical protein